MIHRFLMLSVTTIAIAGGLQGIARAQVYRFDGEPYGNANFGTNVIDQVLYESLGNGTWRWKVQVIRAADGAVLRGFEIAGNFTEVSRGKGELQLRPVAPDGAPVKLTDNGSYLFRTYPELPVPDGIDPNEKRWWRSKGNGRWVSGRPD